jgi:ATP sulfurylase
VTEEQLWVGRELQNGLLFGLPVVLDTNREDIVVGDKVLLKYQGKDIAVVEISDKWQPNKPLEALKCYGTSSLEHPAVQMISMERGAYYMGTARPARPARALMPVFGRCRTRPAAVAHALVPVLGIATFTCSCCTCPRGCLAAHSPAIP